MSKDKLTDYSATNASNTDVGGVNINEGMLPSDVNNAIREVMTHLKDFAEGTEAVNSLAVDNININGNTISSTDTNGDITIDPNGTGDIVLDANVGISNTAPDFNLSVGNSSSVNPSIQIMSATNSNAQLLFGDGAGAAGYRGTVVYGNATDSMSFSTAGSERMRLTSAGRLGISTSNPLSALHVAGAVDVSPAASGFHAGMSGNYAAIEMAGSAGGFIDFQDATDGNDHSGRIIYAHSDDTMKFSTAGAQRLTITGGGLVGINTTSPDSNHKLEVASGGTAEAGIRSGNTSEAILNFGRTNDRLRGRIAYNNSSEYMAFWTNQGEKMRLTSAGSLGLGTAAPTSASGGKVLAVETTADEHTNLVFNTANTGRNGIIEGRRTGRSGSERFAQINIENNSDNGEIRFYTAPSGSDVSERMRLDASGNLLIGGTSLGENGAVTMAGDGRIYAIRASDTAGFFGRTGADGSIVNFTKDGTVVGSVSVTSSGTTYNTTSDIRLKQDIEPLVATDKLMQMNPVSYAWKSDPDGPRSMGFIAQEMQEVMPEAVSTGDDDMMSMDYGRITPILVSALQDAHRKIEQLEQRIADMEAK